VSKIIEPKNNFTHIFLEEDHNNMLDGLLTLWKMIEFVQKRIGCFGCWRLLISSTEYSRSQLHRMCDTLFSAFFCVFFYNLFFYVKCQSREQSGIASIGFILKIHIEVLFTSLGFTIFHPRASLPRYIYVLLLFSRDWSLDYIECMVCNWWHT
jgi:hypothetical protein